MKIDYHMHFERGSYDCDWAAGFFRAAEARGLDEVGFTEHSHGFPEFRQLYYDDLTLDDSPVGVFQRDWLTKNKFKYTLDEYVDFMAKLARRGHSAKIALEVCNFQDQAKVKAILERYAFDYLIGSVHFVFGWGFDASAVQEEFTRHSLRAIYDAYATEVEHLCESGLYDVLGHPFNLRVYRYLPDFDVTPYLERVARAMKKADMAVDVNTGTLYRYPIAEISPYPDFMAVAADYALPIITSSDAHEPEDCGAHIDDAIAYAKRYGYDTQLYFSGRDRKAVPLG
ncbi:MAG: PHP domain-containing protein [Schwartzia sp. (in: firmicutes)]